MFDISLLNKRRFGEAEKRNKAQVDVTGEYSMYFKNPEGGPWVQAFETQLELYHGRKHAVACSNGTSALHISLEAVLMRKYGVNYKKKLKPKVCTTPYSFIATASSIVMAGAEPVFIDVDPVSGTIPAYGDSGAGIPRDCRIILPVHLLGTPANMEAIMVNDTWDYVVEDHAQSLGAEYNGRKCGSLGDLATCSFQYTKTITTDGEGGAVLTDDEGFYETLLQLRSHGSQYKKAAYTCYNYRMTETQAAVGVAQLEKLEGFLATQRNNAIYIRNHLPNGLYPPENNGNVEPTFFLIPLIFNEKDAGMTRDSFLERCTEKGVNQSWPGASVSAGYQTPLYDLPSLVEYKPKQFMPNVDRIMSKSVWLDIHRWHTLDEVKQDLETMKEILNHE